MTEPLPSPLQKGAGLFRFQCMLRSKNVRSLVRYLRKVLDGMTFPAEVVVIADVDPMQIC
jgi:primosomal protein N'